MFARLERFRNLSIVEDTLDAREFKDSRGKHQFIQTCSKNVSRRAEDSEPTVTGVGSVNNCRRRVSVLKPVEQPQYES